MINNFISKKIDYDIQSEDIFTIFSDEPYVFFLDSSISNAVDGRFSYIGFDPFDIFSFTGKDALLLLKEKFSVYKQEQSFACNNLRSGIVGAFSYDYGLKHLNIEVKKKKKEHSFPDCFFGFYDVIIAVDHLLHEIILCSSGLPEKIPTLRYKKAHNRIEYVLEKIKRHLKQYNHKKTALNIDCDFPRNKLLMETSSGKPDYIEKIKQTLEYIRIGDIYQANISQRFNFDLSGNNISAIDIYKKLRILSPSSFSGYMDCGNFQIISSSPEQLLRLDGNILFTKPMKGTRPRDSNKKADCDMFLKLQNSKKDIAELLMITDLERNDIGKVCKYGSVVVQNIREIEEYNTVFQAVSLIKGELRKGNDCFDVIEACFPGGSVTGCPKKRSVEIIDELEQFKRGFYTGSMGYIDFSGNMNFNILIRTIIAQGKKILFNVGGGIIADSSPEEEYEETLVKANAMFQCIAGMLKHEKLVR